MEWRSCALVRSATKSFARRTIFIHDIDERSLVLADGIEVPAGSAYFAVMNAKKIRERAEERASFGYSRQHIYDELMMELPDEKPEKIAKVVRYVPSLAAREHFKSYHQGLLVCIIAFALLQLLRPFVADDVEVVTSWRTFRLLPFATIFLGIAVYRYRGETLQWLAFINGLQVFALFGDLTDLSTGRVDGWNMAQHGLCVAIAALAAYLAWRMYPNYQKEKDPLENMRPRIVFPPEPGMYRM